MLIPRYFFSHDFSPFAEYFMSQPHKKRTFHKGELLWKVGQPHDTIHYIVSGVEMNYADHESGRRKIISFHGAGTVFPGYHQHQYKIERALVTQALTDMRVLEFTIPQFQTMFEQNTALSEQIVNWYSMYVNSLLFSSIHQEYNSSLVKICNLLYLLTINQPADAGTRINLTQDELAELLGLSRVQLTRGLSALRQQNIISTSRGAIQVLDLPRLLSLCSSEV